MLIAAAVCPHPPLLVPEATGGPTGPGDAELTRLRQACDAAVAALTALTTLTASEPDVLVFVVGGAERTTRYPPDAAGTLRNFGVRHAFGAGPPVLPLSLTIGRWLLARAGHDGAQLQSIAADAPPEECLMLGARLAAESPRVAMLAMGDGPARRARGVPGAQDPAADRYDERIAKSLAAADLGLLETLDPAQDAELFVAGRAAWQVLAGAALAGAGPASAALASAALAGAALASADPAGADRRPAFRAELHYAAAPFEVSYFVASLRTVDPPPGCVPK